MTTNLPREARGCFDAMDPVPKVTTRRKTASKEDKDGQLRGELPLLTMEIVDGEYEEEQRAGCRDI